MRAFENQCTDCATPSYPCQGEHCPRRRVPVFYCDECREQATLYEYNGKELCADCLLKNFEIVEGSDEDGIF